MTEQTNTFNDPKHDFKAKKLGYTANREYKYTHAYYFRYLYNNMGWKGKLDKNAVYLQSRLQRKLQGPTKETQFPVLIFKIKSRCDVV